MLNCQKCDNPCFDFEETGMCPREAKLPPAVCPMFDDIPTNECRETNVPAAEVIPN